MTKYLAGYFLFFLMVTFFVFPLLHKETNAGMTNNPAVKIMQREAIGKFLAAGNGMTLYSYARDTKDKSNCIEGCALNWPPFLAKDSTMGEGLDPSNFSSISRDDGRKQTTYKGKPLYYFKNDKYPSDIFGQGLGEVWFLVTP